MMRILKISQQAFIFILFLCFIVISYAEPLPQQTVLVLGDSLSSGFKIKEGKNWVSLLQQCINNMHEDVLVINESVNNNTTTSGIKHLSESLNAYQPDIVIIALGTHDKLSNMSDSETVKNLEKMILLSRQNDAKILLVGSPLHTPEQQLLFKTLSTQNDVALVSNLYMEIEDNSPELFIDELHANTQAQQTIMNTIWKQLFPILGF